MTQFHSSVARRSANILMAQCADLGLHQVQAHPDGTVSALLSGAIYTFAWNIAEQKVDLVQVYSRKAAA